MLSSVSMTTEPSKAVTLVPRMPLYPIAQADVERGIDYWLDSHWDGGVFVPDELREVAVVA